jgi:hypothetical protein
VPVGNNLKNGCLPSVDRAGGVGPGTSRLPRGRDIPKNFCKPLPRALSRIRKFLIREEVPEAGNPPGQRAGGIPPGQWAGCSLLIFFCYFLLEFMIYNLFEIQTIFKYNIDSPYSFVYI